MLKKVVYTEYFIYDQIKVKLLVWTTSLEIKNINIRNTNNKI